MSRATSPSASTARSRACGRARCGGARARPASEAAPEEREARRARVMEADMPVVVWAPARSALRRPGISSKAGHDVDGRRAAAGGGARDELGQWRRHPCERGRALVAARHAAQDPRAGSARRMRRCCCATAPSRICGAGGSTSRATARPNVSRQCPRQSRSGAPFAALAAGDRRRDRHRLRPRHATACSRSTARRNRSMRAAARLRRCWREHGLLFERVDVDALRRARAGACRDTRRPWPARSISSATRSATATSSRKAWPLPARRAA